MENLTKPCHLQIASPMQGAMVAGLNLGGGLGNLLTGSELHVSIRDGYPRLNECNSFN